MLGKSLSDRNITVAHVKDVNLPYVFLSRAILHYKFVSERNHARREALVIEAGATLYISGNIADNTRSQLNKIYSCIRHRGHDSGGKSLHHIIETLLTDPKYML